MRIPIPGGWIGRWLAGALAGLMLVATAPNRVAAAEIIDRVLAVVSGDLIMLSDLRAARDLHLLASSEAAGSDAEILSRLVNRALILAEVERYAPPEPGVAAVDRRIDAVRVTFPTADAYAAALARVGFDEKQLRERMRQDLRIAAYLDQRFTVQPPDETDLQRYYQEHLQVFTQDGVAVPLEQARPLVIEAASAERRQRLVDDWVAGLRRRAEIIQPPDAADPR